MNALSRPLLLLLALAGGAAAQVLDPESHVLVLAPGQSAKVTVSAGDCLSGFTPKTTTPAVVSFVNEPGKPAKSRSFKVTALGAPGSVGNFRVDVLPQDGACGSLSVHVVAVFVVADPKLMLKTWKAGDKLAQPPLPGVAGRQKQLGLDLKQVAADHAVVGKAILAQLAAGFVTLPPVLPPGPGAEETPAPPGVALELTQSERALAALALAEEAALERAEASWWRAIEGLAFDAAKLLVLGGASTNPGYTVPPALRPGSGGEWDAQVAAARKQLQTTVGAIDAASVKTLSGVRSLSQQRGETLQVVSRELTFPVLGTGGASPVGGVTADLEQDLGLDVLSARAWNGPTDNGFDTINGRLSVIARMPGEEAWFQVQRLDFFGANLGPASGAVHPVDPDTHLLFAIWPPANDPANLAPGPWRVTILGPNNARLEFEVVVPGT